MNILQLIAANLRAGRQTNRYPDRPIPAAGFRGPVVVDPSICLTCGVCEEVCVSAAIEVCQGETAGSWSYDPGRCTFCGACVRHCPVQALHQEPDRGPWYVRPGETGLHEAVAYPPCAACGRPTLPPTAALLRAAYPGTDVDLAGRAKLCPDCRSRASAAAMRQSYEALL
jgi:ferredoxin